MYAEEPVNNNGNTGSGQLAVFPLETGISHCQGLLDLIITDSINYDHLKRSWPVF